jgi:hypothetical protein
MHENRADLMAGAFTSVAITNSLQPERNASRLRSMVKIGAFPICEAELCTKSRPSYNETG